MTGIEHHDIERRLAEIDERTCKIEHQIGKIERQVEKIEQIVWQIRYLLQHPQPTTMSRFSAVIFTGDFPMADNALVLNVGQTSTATPITFLADGTTPSGATYSAATYTFSDPSATVTLNPDGVTALVTGVAASTGAISGSVTFTATDTDGAVSVWVNPFTITVNGGVVPPAQLSQSSALQFSTPA